MGGFAAGERAAPKADLRFTFFIKVTMCRAHLLNPMLYVL